MNGLLKLYGDRGMAFSNGRCICITYWNLEIGFQFSTLAPLARGSMRSEGVIESSEWIDDLGIPIVFCLLHKDGPILIGGRLTCIDNSYDYITGKDADTEAKWFGNEPPLYLPPKIKERLYGKQTSNNSDEIAAAVAAEREACAREAETASSNAKRFTSGWHTGFSDGAKNAADRIRARGSDAHLVTTMLEQAKAEERERIAKAFEDRLFDVSIGNPADNDNCVTLAVPLGNNIAAAIRRMD